MTKNLSSSRNDGINEINITPFVDIVLVLLIIFMISTPALVYRGLKISLPKTMNGEDLSHVTLHLFMNQDGGIYLDKRKVTFDGLKGVFRKLQDLKVQSDAIISADQALPHGRVMELSDFLKSQGFDGVGFATAPKRK